MTDAEILRSWPQSRRLVQALAENRAEPVQYTLPGVKHVFDEFSSASTNNMPTDFVTFQDDNALLKGLKDLISAGCLEYALFATSECLSRRGHGLGTAGSKKSTTLGIYQIWSVRFQIMWALQKYTEIIDELGPFEELDAPDQFFEYYRELSPIKGSMVPFAMRLIHAEILRFTPFPLRAFSRIAALEAHIESVLDLTSKTDNTKAYEIWKCRQRKATQLKLRTLTAVQEYSIVTQCANNMISEMSLADGKGEALEALLRIAMSVGDAVAVDDLMTQCAGLGSKKLVAHKALRAIFLGNYAHAIEHLEKIASTGSSALNALAVCHLYNGEPSRGLELLLQAQLPKSAKTNAATLADVSVATARKEEIKQSLGIM